MPLIRGHHFLDGKFAQIPNDYLRDNRLTLKARGLLALLMSHKEGWSLSIQSLAEHNQEGREAIRTAIKELEEFGYLERYQENANGKFGEVVFITKDPADLPLPENPTAGNLGAKNTSLKEDYVKNTKDTKKINNKKTAKVIPPDFQPKAEDVDLMKELFPWVDLKKQTYAFKDYWVSQPPSKARKTNWDATWRNWIRRAADYNKPKDEPKIIRHRFTTED